MQKQRSSSCCQTPQPGMVQGAVQQIYQVYPTETAILRGTLYPELDKPMQCAETPTGSVPPSPCQANGFAAWELRLYLNTHPYDGNALQFYRQLCQQQPGSYACAFVPCTENGWKWIDDPWPWEICTEGRRA